MEASVRLFSGGDSAVFLSTQIHHKHEEPQKGSVLSTRMRTKHFSLKPFLLVIRSSKFLYLYLCVYVCSLSFADVVDTAYLHVPFRMIHAVVC